MIFTEFDSPVGRIYIAGDGRAITGLYMPNHKHWPGPDAAARRADDELANVREQLVEYFAGTRQTFDLPLVLRGTPFQQRVWQELTQIPFGATISYAELARRVGKATGFRAVGNANGRNPVSIIVPCHRVVASDGALTGYGGGVENKRRLLEWEKSVVAGDAGERDGFEFKSRDRSCSHGAINFD